MSTIRSLHNGLFSRSPSTLFSDHIMLSMMTLTMTMVTTGVVTGVAVGGGLCSPGTHRQD